MCVREVVVDGDACGVEADGSGVEEGCRGEGRAVARNIW